MSHLKFQSVIASLYVRSTAAAIAYYRDKLGFREAFILRDPHQPAAEPEFALMSRDGVEIGLNPQTDGARAGSGGCYFKVTDVQAVHREFAANGVNITQPPQKQSWGLTDFTFNDLDGNKIGVGGNGK
jgi:uncharacterized glyoxalase superfamily protein PhnB